MDLMPIVQKLSVLTKNLQGASTIRERVRIADRIFDVLADIERQVEGFVVNELGQTKSAEIMVEPAHPSADRFRKMTIAEAGKALLAEHGQLHGKELERLLKAGGYQSKAEHFQSTILVAFRRDGGFENVGSNTWRLKPVARTVALPNSPPKPRLANDAPIPGHLR